MKVLVSNWWRNRQEPLTLFEGDDEITLRSQGDTLLLGAQLTSTSSERPSLEHWMRLGAASLNHFQGALAQKADTGALWLIQSLRADRGEAYVLGSLEALLNQRDTWRAIIARPAQNLKPTPLRSRSY
jgi:hypothetical protein